jgi:hypothetical protein
MDGVVTVVALLLSYTVAINRINCVNRMTIHMVVCAVGHLVVKNVANGLGIRIMPIRGDPLWRNARHGPC